MKILYGINDKFEEELKKLCNKDELTMAEVDAVYKMVDVIKDIATIEAMHNANMLEAVPMIMLIQWLTILIVITLVLEDAMLWEDIQVAMVCLLVIVSMTKKT